MSDARLLEGMKVLDLSGITAGGRSTQMLADYGADVVKLEGRDRPDPFRHWTAVTGESGADDLSSPSFRVVSRNKRAIALDLKKPQSREVMQRLVAWSDIVIENFRSGVIERLGLSFENLREFNDRVVLLSLSSQGGVGPTREFISYGVTLEALGGLVSMTGYDADELVWSTPKVNYPDQMVSLLAPGIAVWAVMESERTGQALHVDLSQRESVTALIGEWVLKASLDGQQPAPVGNRVPDAVEFCVRAAGEDEWVAVTVADDEQWIGLCTALGQPDLVQDARFASSDARTANQEQIAEIVERWTVSRDKDTAATELQQHGVPAAAILRACELDAESVRRGESFHVNVPRDDGSLERHIGGAFVIDDEIGPDIRTRPPHLGEHTREVLQMVDLDEESIAQLFEDDVAFENTPSRL